MTRRRTFDFMAAATAGTWGCSAQHLHATAKVASIVKRMDLAVVPILWTNTLTPEAVDVYGNDVGKLLLPEKPWVVSVSPDCGWIAWALRESQPPPVGAGDAKVFYMDARSSIKTVHLDGGYPQHLSLSSDAEHLAVDLVSVAPQKARLIVLKPRTGDPQRDLSGLVTRFQIADITRLCISANGQRLAVGTRERFVIIDIQAGTVLLASEGQFPSLSPNGDFIAFINKTGMLVLTSLVTRASREVMVDWRTVVGLGPWSPDGTFLLAGITGGLSLFTRLAAIECATGEFTEIIPRMVEGDRGEQSAWVKRRFLT
jgi:hypothetical protein